VSSLTIDLSALGFCDSAGINALVKMRKACDAAGSSFAVISLQPQVRRVFELTGLIEFLSVGPN
jgi:anti-sigma B factor antagonist